MFSKGLADYILQFREYPVLFILQLNLAKAPRPTADLCFPKPIFSPLGRRDKKPVEAWLSHLSGSICADASPGRDEAVLVVIALTHSILTAK